MDLITVLGPTSSGKTQLSLDLAHHLIQQGKSSVIINCDSRQIYKKLNLGTGKIPGDWKEYNKDFQAFYYQNIPHFLIDEIEPEVRFSLADFLVKFTQLFERELMNFEGTVLLVGGTGLWAKAIIDEYQPGIVQEQHQDSYEKAKSNLQEYELNQLQNLLISKKDTFNESDWSNPRRLLNAVLREKIVTNNWAKSLDYPHFESKKTFAINTDKLDLAQKIKIRLQQRIDEGLIEEVETLLYLENRLLELGLEYRLTYLYLLGQLTEDELLTKLIQENQQYSKRQLTWLNKQKDIHWLTISPAFQIDNLTI